MTNSQPIRIWYVSGQKLCNYDCDYCVSVGDYAKSTRHDWSTAEQTVFRKVVAWLGSRPFPLGLRLATLGEPFASKTFLDGATWLLEREHVEFVELVTNGSLLKTRLARMQRRVDLSKLSLWITYHHTEAKLERLISNALLAQEQYGVSVVVNALLFPDNTEAVERCRDQARAAGLRFNVDLGYHVEPERSSVALLELTPEQMAPILAADHARARAVALGANEGLYDLAFESLGRLDGTRCRSGHRYFFIGIHGDVHRCSRYAGLGRAPLGSVLDAGFRLPADPTGDSACTAGSGCTNKEDFLHRQIASTFVAAGTRSLGWATALPPRSNR